MGGVSSDGSDGGGGASGGGVRRGVTRAALVELVCRRLVRALASPHTAVASAALACVDPDTTRLLDCLRAAGAECGGVLDALAAAAAGHWSEGMRERFAGALSRVRAAATAPPATPEHAGVRTDGSPPAGGGPPQF